MADGKINPRLVDRLAADPSVGRHHIDVEIPGGFRRSIRSWANYRMRGGIWTPSNPALEGAGARPDDWPFERYDAQFELTRQPLQTWFGRDVPGGAPALVTLRVDERPDVALTLVPWGAANKALVPVPTDLAVHWDGLWSNTELWYLSGPGRLAKELRLTAAGHPAAFQFGVLLSSVAGLRAAGGGFEVFDARDGAAVMSLRAPWASDASGRSIRCWLRAGDGVTYRGQSLPSIWLELEPADLVGATYPITVDPTTTISGASAIDDNWILYRQGYTDENTNYGGSASAITWYGVGVSGGTWFDYGLVRISSVSLIPSGTYNAFRFSVMAYASASTPVVNVYRITDANTWVEGTLNGGVQVGSSCWSYAKYNTQPWAGSAGCSTSGVDYDADASPPSITVTPGQRKSFNLPVSWLSAWKSGARVNNGFTVRAAGYYPRLYSSDSTSPNNAYFEIDYTPSSGGPLGYYYRRRR